MTRILRLRFLIFGVVLLGVSMMGISPSSGAESSKSVWIDAPKTTLSRNVANFQGMEVRAVRDLSHVDSSTLRAMADKGFSAKTVNGDKIILHHHKQNPLGPIIEVPAPNHSIGNAVQHPFGNTTGAGLTAAERTAFNTWRTDYWKSRAAQELSRRAGN